MERMNPPSETGRRQVPRPEQRLSRGSATPSRTRCSRFRAAVYPCFILVLVTVPEQGEVASCVLPFEGTRFHKHLSPADISLSVAGNKGASDRPRLQGMLGRWRSLPWEAARDVGRSDHKLPADMRLHRRTKSSIREMAALGLIELETLHRPPPEPVVFTPVQDC